MICDTHAHLTSEHLSDDLPNYLELARQANVHRILCVGTTAEDSLESVKLAQSHPEIRAAVGIHPNTCCQAQPDAREAIKEMSTEKGVVAIGETGLDRYWDDCPWESQLDNFRWHLALSRETQLPVVIHTRDCAEETLTELQEFAKRSGEPAAGVMHSFTGPQTVADGCLELGMYISFAGMVTFKNAKEIQEIARVVPADRLLIETDSPYLTPHPFRGKRPNHPAMVVHTLEFLASIREVAVDDLADTTIQNAMRLFSKW